MQVAQRFTNLQFSGDDWREWLQGQITQDVRLLSPENPVIEFCLCKPTGQMLCHGTLSNDGLMSIPTSCVQVVLDRVDLMVILEECFVERMGEIEVAHDQLKPIWSIDMTETNFPAEMGPDFETAVISYTKGCYTGQEINHRLHARGHTNKTWQWLVSENKMDVGETVVDGEGAKIGTVTRCVQQGDTWLVAAFIKNGSTPAQPLYQP
jgi:folate-binding protein YgfZ